MSIWWRDHLGPRLAALTAEYGPFSRCNPANERRALLVGVAPPEVLAQLASASCG